MRDPIGTVRIRTQHKRHGDRQRAFIKVADPDVWRLRAHVVWELANGPIPRGMGIHHRDENPLNDAIDNLEMVSKSEHMKIHRASFNARRVEMSTAARRRLRWSTRSTTKRVGRHPSACDCPLHGGRP